MRGNRIGLLVAVCWCLAAGSGHGQPESPSFSLGLAPEVPPPRGGSGAYASGSQAQTPAAGQDGAATGTTSDQAVPPHGAPPSVHAPYLPGYKDVRILPIDLPYALHLVNASNPTIAIARERIREAYAVLGQSQVLWIPNIWLGGNPEAPAFLPMFYHHDGELQTARGYLFPVTKNNFFLQAGASLEVHLADAFFAPHIARYGVEAAAARARATTNDVQLDVALTYLDLLRLYAELAINDEALRNARVLLDAAESAVKAGLGRTPADANQARVEVEVLRQQRIDLQGQAGMASARLSQLLLLDATADLLPGDQTVVPIALVPCDGPLDELVAVGLMQRPELAEDRATIATALARWRQAKYEPLIPSLQAFYWGGDFTGRTDQMTPPAPGGSFSAAGGRNDVMVQLSWEIKNGGLGNLFQSRERNAQYNIAKLRLVETQARVAAEVTAAAKMVRSQERTLTDAQVGVRNAETLWRRLRDLAFGVGMPARQFDPIQPLLAEQALRQARMQYLTEVIEYNRYQFRLYWALGQPPQCALPRSKALPVETSVLPPTGSTTTGERKDTGKEQRPEQ
jgi:outer membrane protein TolC